MKKVFLMLSAIGILTISSCSKDKNEPGPEEITVKECILKSSEDINSYNNVKRFYTYDQNSNISRIDYDTEKSTHFQTFIYEKDKITSNEEEIFNFGKENEINTYKLDAKGRIITVIEDPDRPGVTCSYNAEGYLVQTKETDHEDNSSITTVTYSYANGNLIKVVNERVDNSGLEFNVTTNITYTDELLNNQAVFAKLYNSFLPDETDELTAFLGKRSKNLPAKYVIVETYKTAEYNRTATLQFTYLKDVKKNVTSVKAIQTTLPVSDPFSEEFKFTYICD
ncbi:hypothetical protein [Pedobacter gandavensis]|uniref:hypothetical protein n=1 Tax=Pedobacter gandavensis TaxID=2679963 RepID=UPI00292E24A1|nr:hypothetical protein [Pedobacter gandavensis]